MFENLSIGLDIATALSVITAATAFIWNSIISKRNELNERKKAIIQTQVFKVTDRILEESSEILYEETNRIRNIVRGGVTEVNLEPWKEMILKIPNSFRQLIPIDDAYCGDGRFKKLFIEFYKDMDDFTLYFLSIIESGESWNFESVMDIPNEITLKYITKLYQESEEFIEKL
ncbi:MAG: hypothetical protein QM499_02980 [Flavobacteriaceae bacterium]